MACGQSQDVLNVDQPPKVVAADEKFADVYKILDGVWKGEFIIYEDTQLEKKRKVDLKNLSIENIKAADLKEVNRIHVTQTYTSETPYFQRVKIEDYYPNTGKTEVSQGANKVQNGKMWCVVYKPNDTVVHEGSIPSKNTIIWQSSQKSPVKIEYFQEEVSEEFYEIIGYGYYSGDDPKLSPKLWFYSRYERQ
jgi:hypothetical protein